MPLPASIFAGQSARWLLSVAIFAALCPAAFSAQAQRPNVVLIMSDDQGYADFGFQGNPVVKTPRIDRLAHEGVELEHFYVSPVCTPTRASLMTGRWNYRTRAIDTFSGRAMMDPAEVTIAEMLAESGYKTGIFGKWHLGDCYPMRAMDQGFQESLVIFGGGLCQPADPPEGNDYFNPTVSHNGHNIKTSGYCSDVYTDAAIEFIGQNRQQPFFVYLPFNAPHGPFLVADKYADPYRQQDLSEQRFRGPGQPVGKISAPDLARVYGMETNLDENVGRLLDKLDEWKLADNTIVIFLTDNGPATARYRAGLRGLKGSVYEGGTRTTCVIRGPGVKRPHGKLSTVAAHVDWPPTILAACGVTPSKEVEFDGLSLWRQLQGDDSQAWPERKICLQWHRGDVPELYRAFSIREGRYKLLQAAGVPEKPRAGQAKRRAAAEPKEKFELFDIEQDPNEERDLASGHPEIVERLKKSYEAWFQDVSSTRGYEPPRIILGSRHENPVLLTRQDGRGPKPGSPPTNVCTWEVDLATAGPYRFKVLFNPTEKAGKIVLKVGAHSIERRVEVGDREAIFEFDDVPRGPASIEPTLKLEGGTVLGAKYVRVEKQTGTAAK